MTGRPGSASPPGDPAVAPIDPGAAIPMEDYDYVLPPDRIAQEPAPQRDASRLMVLDRRGGGRRHLRFIDLAGLLQPGDLVVLNDTRVRRARLWGRKPTGGRVEFLFLGPGKDPRTWEALSDSTRELRPGMRIRFGEDAVAVVRGRGEERVLVGFPSGVDVEMLMERRGETPLPPYIHRRPGDPRGAADRERYQTVYARQMGAVAAPTAGLHFTPDLLRRLERQGVRLAHLTLHVGPGTFQPVRVSDARRHRMAPERFLFPPETGERIRATRRAGGRVVAVGTTVARVLEQVAREGDFQATAGECHLYVLPGHTFRAVDALITNFHLPRSTLLLFGCAFAGRDTLLDAYREAVEREYRFYSYGDAMLIR